MIKENYKKKAPVNFDPELFDKYSFPVYLFITFVSINIFLIINQFKDSHRRCIGSPVSCLNDAGVASVSVHIFVFESIKELGYNFFITHKRKCLPSGVKITSFPAIHSLDGSVSYRLDWHGLSFVFGGDSAPNKWFIEQAKGADFVIHECFYTPEGLASYLGFPPRQAVQVSSYIHTPPAAFGKIMSTVKPRLAVGYHAILVPEMLQDITDNVRSTYDGPLVIATDLMW